jgi:hypothetical protein
MKVRPILFWIAAILTSLRPAAAEVPASHAMASYLTLFARYVEWPAGTGGEAATRRPFVVGVLGHDPFGGVLEMAFARREVDGRPITVKRVGSAVEARACDLVFISREESRRLVLWLAELADAPVLTVSDAEPALENGAAVVLVVENTPAGDKLRFDVNLTAVERAGLKVSSRMIVSARRILPEPRKGP